jgi:hypothetical protein
MDDRKIVDEPKWRATRTWIVADEERDAEIAELACTWCVPTYVLFAALTKVALRYKAEVQKEIEKDDGNSRFSIPYEAL